MKLRGKSKKVLNRFFNVGSVCLYDNFAHYWNNPNQPYCSQLQCFSTDVPCLKLNSGISYLNAFETKSK